MSRRRTGGSAVEREKEREREKGGWGEIEVVAPRRLSADQNEAEGAPWLSWRRLGNDGRRSSFATRWCAARLVGHLALLSRDFS